MPLCLPNDGVHVAFFTVPYTFGDSNKPLDCVKSMEVPSPGYTVWTTLDGYCTTHLTFESTTRKVTLRLLTLCPTWKRSPIKAQYWNKAKQDTGDEWTGPSASTQFE